MGTLTLVDGPLQLTPEVSLMPTPSHTPWHMSVSPLSVDDERNEGDMHALLYGSECRLTVERLYSTLLRDMTERSYEQSDEILKALDCLQMLTVRAVWKYEQEVGPKLEEFAREFDRLDIESERMRLYEYSRSVTG